jgi:hypothetical protein
MYTFSMMFNSRYAGGRASSCPMSRSHSFFWMRRDPKVRPAYDDICTARWPTGKKRRQIHNDTVPVPTMEDFPDVLHNSGSDGDTRSIQVRGPKRCAHNLQSSYCVDRYVVPRKICYSTTGFFSITPRVWETLSNLVECAHLVWKDFSSI